MQSNSNYPPMSQDELEKAPFNEREQEDRDFNVTVSQTLSKTVPVITNDYNLEVVSEPHNQIHERIVDTSETSWRDVYAENDYHTPEQLLKLFKRYLEYLLDRKTVVPVAPSFLKMLIKDCEDWIVDDEEFVEC